MSQPDPNPAQAPERLTCAECGYELSGIGPDQACPECGAGPEHRVVGGRPRRVKARRWARVLTWLHTLFCIPSWLFLAFGLTGWVVAYDVLGVPRRTHAVRGDYPALDLLGVLLETLVIPVIFSPVITASLLVTLAVRWRARHEPDGPGLRGSVLLVLVSGMALYLTLGIILSLTGLQQTSPIGMLYTWRPHPAGP